MAEIEVKEHIWPRSRQTIVYRKDSIYNAVCKRKKQSISGSNQRDLINHRVRSRLVIFSRKFYPLCFSHVKLFWYMQILYYHVFTVYCTFNHLKDDHLYPKL